jgi:hypothetical protein
MAAVLSALAVIATPTSGPLMGTGNGENADLMIVTDINPHAVGPKTSARVGRRKGTASDRVGDRAGSNPAAASTRWGRAMR